MQINPNERTLVFVKWDDAMSSGAVYAKAEEAARVAGQCIIHSAGMFVSEDAKRVYIGEDYMPDVGTYRSIMSVPKCNILEMQLFELPEPKPVRKPAKKKVARRARR